MMHMSMQAQITQRQSVVFTPQLQQAIKLLLLNNLELAKYADSAAEENPFLEVERPKALRGLPSLPGKSSDSNEFDPVSLLEDTSGYTFRAHVFNQVDELITDPKERAIGYALAADLEPTGWLPSPLSVIAENLKVEIDVVEGVLAQVQKAEPEGLFARNLAECLKLQVKGKSEEDARLLTLIENLSVIQNGYLLSNQEPKRSKESFNKSGLTIHAFFNK